MSSITQLQPIRLARTMPRTSGTSGRSFAAMITAAAAVLALVLATALPAHADRKDDLTKAAIAALILGAIVAANNKDKNKNKDKDRGKYHNRGHNKKRIPVVPAACEIEFQGAHRSVSVYPESCLRRQGFDYELPRDCANRARIYGKWDRIYSVQCLRDAGFRVLDR